MEPIHSALQFITNTYLPLVLVSRQLNVFIPPHKNIQPSYNARSNWSFTFSPTFNIIQPSHPFRKCTRQIMGVCAAVLKGGGLGARHVHTTRRELDLFVLRPFIFGYLYNLALLHPPSAPTSPSLRWWNFEENRNEWARDRGYTEGTVYEKFYSASKIIILRKYKKGLQRAQLYRCGPPFDINSLRI